MEKGSSESERLIALEMGLKYTKSGIDDIKEQLTDFIKEIKKTKATNERVNALDEKIDDKVKGVEKKLDAHIEEEKKWAISKFNNVAPYLNLLLLMVNMYLMYNINN